YDLGFSLGQFVSGTGQSRLACVPWRLPERTRSSLPTSATAVGYQSVGMRPSNFPVATLNAATALLSASATNRRLPSGLSATALGVLPSGGAPGAASC